MRCFTLARFNEAFLVLRAQQRGVAMASVPLVLMTMNLVYCASGYGAAFTPHGGTAFPALALLALLLRRGSTQTLV